MSVCVVGWGGDLFETEEMEYTPLLQLRLRKMTNDLFSIVYRTINFGQKRYIEMELFLGDYTISTMYVKNIQVYERPSNTA